VERFFDTVYFCVCRGFGYVEYESREMAKSAVAHMNNVNFRGCNLQVTWVSVVLIACCVTESLNQSVLFPRSERHSCSWSYNC